MQNSFNKQFIKKAAYTLVLMSGISSASVLAATLDLPSAPLTTTKSVLPNLMLLLDSSGSMNSIVVDSESGYDADTFSYSCPDTYTLDTNDTIELYINTTTGEVIIVQDNDEYEFYGTSTTVSTYTVSTRKGGNNNNNNDNDSSGYACFDDESTYTAILYASSSTNYDGSTYYSSNSGSAEYTGSYLNWYFSNDDQSEADTFVDDDGNALRKKDGTQTRMEVAKEAATDLIQSLDDIRVGLAEYDGSSGAYLLTNIGDVDDSTQEATLIEEVDGLEASGYTPLAEALQGLGYYYSIGNSANLTLHPDEDNEQDASPTDIFLTATFDKPSSLTLPDEVITNWCQDSFILAMTDGLPTQDSNISSYLKNYYDNDSDYPEDVVLAMYEMDMRPDLYEDEAGDTTNNVTTYVVGFSEELEDSEVLTEMAENGGGGDLLTASNSAELTAAFEDITDNIFAKVAAGSGASFNTTSLSEDSLVYAATFNSAAWSGSLAAYPLDDDGEVSETANWDAADKLDAMTYSDRNIFAYNDNSNKGVQFTYTGLADSSLLSDLQAGPLGSDQTSVESLIAYLSGQRDNEGSTDTTYRERTSALGDIVNSTVIYVGKPELDWPNYDENSFFGSSSESYDAFVTEQTSRQPMLYVGANDGMLHGFNADEDDTDVGEEEFAYIPSFIASTEDQKGLHYLADQDYAHEFYVDLSPEVSDVYVSNDWRTVLIGGARSGAKGIFALDITDPTKFTQNDANAEALALWEFSSNDDTDFGYSFSSPTVAMMANGEWAVIVGNGYNNTGDGTAKLFILFIEQGLDGTWTKTNDYIELETYVGATDDINGMSTPTAVDLDGDSVVDRIYAGDLEGNMWAFDVTDSSATNWASAYGTTGSPVPLFTAQDEDGNNQPITTAPSLAQNDNVSTTTSNYPNLLVFFGTGQYIEEADKTTTDVMTYYGVSDDNFSISDDSSTAKTRADLTSKMMLTFDDVRAITGDAINWTSTDGWYIDLVEYTSSTDTTADELGERVIANSYITSGILIFTTAIPNTDSDDVCVSNSESWLMAIDIDTGAAATYTVFDVDGDGDIDEDDVVELSEDESVNSAGIKLDGSMVTSDAAILSDVVYTNDEDGNVNEEDINIETDGVTGRLSWEELINE